MVDDGRNLVDLRAREKKAKDCLAVDKYNVEASEMLANVTQFFPISEAVQIYEQLLSTFPTAAKFWKQYVEAQMIANNEEAVRNIFSRSLLNCLDINLWRCYIRYIRKVNEKKGIDGHEETRKAFDFMLSYVGTDISSGPIWMEYITFLKSMRAITPHDESQRMTSVRKAYQRAIVTPTNQVEQLWKDYEKFENSVSQALAKGLLSEYQPKFNSARAVYRERKKYIDEIDWNMLAIPPSGSFKEEQQCMAWKRLLAFEKGNPQRIDNVSSNRRVAFTYEQCLMYLYHYPDIWYDYASWHAKGGTLDAAIEIFQRSLKALPDSEVLRYSFAELEETRGAIQPAKRIYESLLENSETATALAHIQFIRFLRRTEGTEAARKFFMDARKSPNCTYHVFVAYAMMVFCLDKDPKVAQNVFEAGLKRFMHEPGYILEYADFLCRLNDDRNVRALFERALSLLPPEESMEVWKRFAEFEQIYGDLASMLKVEQRRKEALSCKGEENLSLESSLFDIVSRYSFMDLWPCSSKDLDHLSHLEWLAKNVNKKVDKVALPYETGASEKSMAIQPANCITSTTTKVIRPDVSKMAIYDPRQKLGSGLPPSTTVSGLPTFSTASSLPTHASSVGRETTKPLEEMMKAMKPALVSFISHLPMVEGPTPNVDIVLSILSQCTIPAATTGKPAPLPQQTGTVQSATANNSSTRSQREGLAGKRKDLDGQDEDETAVQSQPLQRDIFRLRQIRKARGLTSSARGLTSSQTAGSASVGSGAISGEPSGSSG